MGCCGSKKVEPEYVAAPPVARGPPTHREMVIVRLPVEKSSQSWELCILEKELYKGMEPFIAFPREGLELPLLNLNR